MSMHTMLERRVALKDQLASLNAAHPDTLPEAAQRQWDELRGQLEGTEAALVRQSLLDETERRVSGRQISGGNDDRWGAMLRDYSLSRAIMAADNSVDAGREREVSAELERRGGKKARGLLAPTEAFMESRATVASSQFVASDPHGGTLVPGQYRGDAMIDLLLASSFLSRLGLSTLDGLMGTTIIPRIDSKGSVSWIGENQETTPSGMTFGSISLHPRTVSAERSYSRRLLINSTPSIDSLIRADIARSIALGLDEAFLTGDGILQPLGLLNQPGLAVQELGPNGAFPGYGSFVDMQAAPSFLNADSGSGTWLTNPKVVARGMKETDPAGRYILAQTLPNSLLGDQVVRSTTVPSDLTKGNSGAVCSAIIYGVFSSAILARWTGVDLLSDVYTRASSGQVRLFAFHDMDIGIRHIESFVAVKDAKTS